MVTTLTDRRAALCAARRAEIDRLAMRRQARAGICGCVRCGDADRGAELDYLIAKSVALVAEIEDRICQPVEASCAS